MMNDKSILELKIRLSPEEHVIAGRIDDHKGSELYSELPRLFSQRGMHQSTASGRTEFFQTWIEDLLWGSAYVLEDRDRLSTYQAYHQIRASIQIEPGARKIVVNDYSLFAQACFVGDETKKYELQDKGIFARQGYTIAVVPGSKPWIYRYSLLQQERKDQENRQPNDGSLAIRDAVGCDERRS